MEILGKTRSGKFVLKDRLAEDSEIYKSFNRTDHYDATCLWSTLDLPNVDEIKNWLWHANKAGLSIPDLEARHQELAGHGRILMLKEVYS